MCDWAWISVLGRGIAGSSRFSLEFWKEFVGLPAKVLAALIEDMTQSENRPRRLFNLPWRQLEGRVVLVHPQAGKVHELNPTASFLWERADGKTTISELAQALTQEFQVSREQALTDTTDFVSQLHDQGVVEFVDPR